ncbi:MAG: TldD/PmbA family protein [Firmicutes bacterium]|nr:TldD/PmbA family protein [Bacillota bacterium]
MSNIREVSEKVNRLLNEKQQKVYAFEVTESEKRELNTENAEFSLYRTIFDSKINVTTIQEGRKGSASGNDLTDEGISKAVDDAILGAASAEPDTANQIAEKQENGVFHTGLYEADMDLFYQKLEDLLGTIEKKHPRIKILALIADHTKSHTIYANSNGTEFETFDGAYHVEIEFAGFEGERTTGLSYTGIATYDLETPLIEQGDIEIQLSDAEKALNQAGFDGKFEGTVVFTPGCLGFFLYMLSYNYLSPSVIMDGTSRWLDKVGEKVASEKITIELKAQDERLVELDAYTDDGYRAENVKVIKNGVLMTHLLDLYAAGKTGRNVTKNSSMNVVMEPGEISLEEIIASVSRGLIVGGFSGGEPGANGEFSGVAKNAFYIENGKIAGAVSETMINGNLEDVFRNVTAISKEIICDGSMALPYMASSGIVISGK